MAEDVSTGLRQVVERVLEADVADQIARRGKEIATSVSEATDNVSARATKAWIESEPQRREAEKNLRRASQEAMGWSRQTWKKQLRPTLKDLWSRRSMAMGATAAAIPVGREVVEDAAVRLGIRKRRESRHWFAFFLGMLLGMAAGAAVALLTTPKPGREMRDELAVKARDAAERAREAADKAREGAGDWVPLFQREAEEGGSEAAPAEPAEGEQPS
jgi:gas vesicle protein